MTVHTQKLFCQVCGKEMAVDFNKPGYPAQGLCSAVCSRELNWRKTLSILNRPYYPLPCAVTDEGGQDAGDTRH
jgi:hypothetical protein